MKKKLLTLLFGIIGFTTTFASFPVTENTNTTEAITWEQSDPEPLSNGEKVLWFFGGLLLTWIGVIIAIITQVSSKKKGQIKYSLFGFGLFLLFIFAMIYFLSVGSFELSNIRYMDKKPDFASEHPLGYIWIFLKDQLCK